MHILHLLKLGFRLRMNILNMSMDGIKSLLVFICLLFLLFQGIVVV